MEGSVLKNYYNVFIEDNLKQKICVYMTEHNKELLSTIGIDSWYKSINTILYEFNSNEAISDTLFYGINIVSSPRELARSAPASITIFFNDDEKGIKRAQKQSYGLPNLYIVNTVEELCSVFLFFAESPSTPYPFYFDEIMANSIKKQINRWIINQQLKGRF